MKRHTLVCPPGFVEQFGKCVPEGNRPDGTRADLVSGDVVPFVPDNVPGGGGGGDDGYDYRGLFDKASKALRYAGMSKKIYDSQQSLEEEMRRYQLGAGEAEEAPLTTEESRLRALTKQYREAEEYQDVAAATEKYEAEQEYNAIIQKMEEDDKIASMLDGVPGVKYEDGEILYKGEGGAFGVEETKGESVEEQAARILDEYEQYKKAEFKRKYGDVDFKGPKGGAPGDTLPIDELPPDVPSGFVPIDELPPDVPVAGYGPEFTDLHSAIVDKGTKSVAAEAVEVEAKEAIVAARAGGAAISVAREANILKTVIAAAQAGEEADVAALIMGGLVTGGVVSMGAVAAVAVEIAALTALNAAAEYALKKAGFGLPDRPESLNQGAHAVTPEEIAYFKALNKNELDTFNSREMREKAGYEQMSAQEQKKFDNGLIKQKKELGRNVDSWDGVDNMVIQQNPSGGFHLFDPGAKKEPRSPELLKQFQEQIGAAPAQEPEMTETEQYLQMMNERDTDYLNSINETQASMPGANGGGIYNPIPNIRVGSGGVTPLPQDQARPRAPMPDYKPAAAASPSSPF